MNQHPTYQDDEDDWYATVISAAFGLAVLAFVVAMGIVTAIVKLHLFTLWAL